MSLVFMVLWCIPLVIFAASLWRAERERLRRVSEPFERAPRPPAPPVVPGDSPYRRAAEVSEPSLPLPPPEPRMPWRCTDGAHLHDASCGRVFVPRYGWVTSETHRVTLQAAFRRMQRSVFPPGAIDVPHADSQGLRDAMRATADYANVLRELRASLDSTAVEALGDARRLDDEARDIVEEAFQLAERERENLR